MKQKLLFVIDSLNSGGAEKSLISVLSIFDHKKYHIYILMFSREGLYKALLPKEVNVLNVPYFIREQRKNVKYFLRNKKYKGLYIRLGTALSLRNPLKKDKLHKAQICWTWVSKGLDKLDSFYDIAIAYSQGIPTYYVAEKVNATKKICWVNTDYKLAGYNNKYDEKYYEQYDNIIAVSDYNKEVFTREMPISRRKTTVIYDILSPDLINSMSNKPEGYKDAYQGLRILTIGRLVDVKGYDLAIEACYRLKEAGIEFKWYAIGEGPLKKDLIQLIRKYRLEDTFILLGTCQNPYVYMNESDIYVQPSRYEGFGLAIAEARILNVPIVATRFDAVYNQIVDGKNGLIAEMNANSLYDGIVELIHDEELRHNIVEYLKNERKGNVEEIKKLYQLIE